jgi:hypothetical protein
MDQIRLSESKPAFFLVTERYALGTAEGISNSDRTIDVGFHDLARNYNLQSKLNLLSAVLLRPAWNTPLSLPMEGRELVEHAATYLGSFTDDREEKEQRINYLVKNGLVRILVTDPDLLEEVKQVV